MANFLFFVELLTSVSNTFNKLGFIGLGPLSLSSQSWTHRNKQGSDWGQLEEWRAPPRTGNMNIFHWCSCNFGCWWPASKVPGWGTGAVALPGPSASLSGSNHTQGTMRKQFWHYPPCHILFCNPYYHYGVQYCCWHKPGCQAVFGRGARVCEQQATLTNAPGLEMVLLMPFGSVMTLLPLAPKLPLCRGRVLPFSMTPHNLQEFRRMWWV